jgi:transcriptional regulator with XRE-family HTH domain
MTGRRDPRKDDNIASGLMHLAGLCRELRLGKGYTLAELAERSDLDLRHVQLIEANMGNPTVATIIRLARGLGVPPSLLLAGVGEPRPSLGETVEPYRSEPMDVALEDDGQWPESDAIVAMRIKSLRLERDWSQAELASRAGISQGAIQAIEARTKSPTLRTLDLIAKALGVQVASLLVRLREVKMPKARAGRY